MIMMIASFILSACAMGPRATGTPGITVEDGVVYVSYMQHVRALDAKTGSENWKYPAESKTTNAYYAPVAISDGSIFFGDLAKKFQKVSLNTQAEVWSYDKTKGWYIAGAVIDGNMVFAPSTDQNLYAFDLSGNLKWKFPTNHTNWASPVVADGVVYLASMDKTVYAINQADGSLIWQLTLNGAIVGSPALSEDGKTLFVATIGNEVVAIDTAKTSTTKTTKWTYTGDASYWAKPLVTEDLVLVSSSKGKIVALDIDSGKFVWSMEDTSPAVGGLTAIPDGFVYVTEAGSIKAFKFDKSRLWQAEIEGQVFNAPVFDGERIYFGAINSDSLVFAFDLNGTLVWSYKVSK